VAPEEKQKLADSLLKYEVSLAEYEAELKKPDFKRYTP